MFMHVGCALMNKARLKSTMTNVQGFEFRMLQKPSFMRLEAFQPAFKV